MRFLRYFILSVLFLLINLNLLAQERRDSVVTTSKKTDFEQFIEQLEKKSGYRFYYNPLHFDSLQISIDTTQKSLDMILNQLLENSDYHYIIDLQRNIFLTKKYEIKGLPKEFFDDSIATVENKEFKIEDYLLGSKKKEVVSSLENKLYELGTKQATPKQGKAVLVGYIREEKTGEPVIGATVYIENPRIGASTDQFGYYSIAIPLGRNVLYIKAIGMKDTKRDIVMYSDSKLNIQLKEQVRSLKEVVVTADKVANIKNVKMGVERLSIKTIKQVPTVFGEADVLRVVLTLPGVKSVGEASTGFNVRGGATDQNLILFNDATIYNPSHFFGFFSAFNPDVIKDVELYKSSIPAKYGGRLSSVLDVSSREGNRKRFSGTAGLGLLTSRLNIEGPIVKDKTSFILGGRTTYSNWLLGLLPEKSGYKNSKASFYDVDLHVAHEFNRKNSLYFTGYLSNDRFNLNSDTTYGYNNKNVSLKWKHSFNNKFYGVLITGYDGYKYNVTSEKNPVNAYQLAFDINQGNLKTNFTYYLNSKNTIDFGVNSIYYKLHPGSFKPNGKESLVVSDIISPEQALESAAYIGDRFDITSALSLDFGIRYSLFNYLGPKSIYTYPTNIPKNEYNLLDTVAYSTGDLIKTYHGPEYRLSVRYAISNNLSVKAGYNTLRQYIHMLSNTTAIAPTDIWKLSDLNIRPQEGDQLSVGVYKNFLSNSIETSVEAYYKRLKNYLDYKSGAVLVLNHHIETDVINTQGKAYGLELMIKKTTGKLNGWMSYTYSRILLRMNDPLLGQLINGGEYYPSNYDKPHDFTLIGNYKFSHRFSVSLNTNYSTGRPITLPIGKYHYAGSERVLYSDRNQYRIPDNFRIDFSMNLEGNHKVNQLTHNSWTLGVYNLTGRKNPYSTYFISENGVVKGYKLSIFGSQIPFINYNIRF